jgi:N-dimethylarginine dimethylaminohydrolase
MQPASQRRFFLSKPNNFKIAYSINPWMNPKNKVNLDEAKKQWESLLEAYKTAGAQVEVFEDLKGWPDSVFGGDSVFLYGNEAFASRFRYPERSGEVEPMVERFRERGYNVHYPPEGLFFEGNGEAIVWNGMIFGGYGVRSDRKAIEFIGETLGIKTLPIRVMPPHFHVDTVLCPLSDDLLAYVPSGMDEDSAAAVEKLGVKLIAIDQEESLLLACNSMALDKNVVVSTHNSPKFDAELKKSGFEVLPLDLSEFAKSGGGAKCLTLEAYQPA